MVRVKVVMGFVLLAAMLKYLSNVDQVLQWNVLTRERFLAAWFVLFALAGLYLLGLLRLEGIDKDEPVGHRTPADRRRSADLRVQPAAGNVRRQARRTRRVRPGRHQRRMASGGSGDRRSGCRVDEEPSIPRRWPRHAPRTSWCW